MNLGFFIARRLTTQGTHNATRRIIKIASASVAISIAVMILAVGIVKGFQQEIKYKITQFNGHTIIKNLDINYSDEMSVFSKNSINFNQLLKNDFVKSAEAFCQKSCIVRTQNDNEGMQCRGISEGECMIFLKNYLKKGKPLDLNSKDDPNQILISQTTSNRLKLDTGQRVELFFIHEGQVRRRKPKIIGIYNTGIYEVDRYWVITDLRMIQRIISSGYDSINGVSVYFNKNENTTNYSKLINEMLPMQLTVVPVEQSHYQIFQWLKLLDMNVFVIIILMILVSVVNMITALVVLIIDRVSMIGLLKALGSPNSLIRKIFLYNGSKYLLSGIIIGNFLGILIGLIQKHTGILSLNEEIYYLNSVPFNINLTDIIILNIITFTVCLILLMIPSLFVSKVNPAKAVKFD